MTQQQLADFLYEEIGIDYTGAAISDWEHNKSKINANDRLLLTSLIKILKHQGGIKTSTDANLLLEAGNYRDLNADEKNKLFPEEIGNSSHQSLPREYSNNPGTAFNEAFFNFPAEFQKILAEAKEGPSPAWPRVVVAVVNKITSQWTIFHFVRLLAWLWIWLITYLMISPSLQWPFDSQEGSRFLMRLYAAGSILIPLLVSAMIGVKNNPFWQDKKTSMLRPYMIQGASVGFHLGYFVIFALSLTQYYFQIQPSIWSEIIKMLIPLSIGYAGAQLVPHNLWRAYGRLHLKDGGIFFIFIILGPLWAWFFLEFYEILITQKLGVILVLLSASMIAGAMAIQYRRKGNTNIPLLWVILFYGLILICQVISLFVSF
ncbi:MAG: hypothetical protein HYZ21_07990 [Chloroflexi bacterium]|nr:hypothetical protein [Chloroflexota bacterium]